MNLEAMREAMQRSRKIVSVNVPELGGDICLQQLSGRAGMSVGLMLGGKEIGQLDPEQSVEFFVALICGSVVDDAKTLMLDTEEGRAFIRSWPFGTLLHVGTEAAKINGLGDSGKN